MPKEISRSDIVHNFFHGRRDLSAGCVRSDREVPASDVEPHAGERNLVCVSDYAPDRLGVALVSVGAEDAALAAGGHATLDLRERRLVVFAKDFRFHPVRLCVRPQVCQASTSSRELISAGLNTALITNRKRRSRKRGDISVRNQFLFLMWAHVFIEQTEVRAQLVFVIGRGGGAAQILPLSREHPGIRFELDKKRSS